MNILNIPIDWKKDSNLRPEQLQKQMRRIDIAKLYGSPESVKELANEFNHIHSSSGFFAIPIGYSEYGDTSRSKSQYMLGFAQDNGANGYETEFVIHPSNKNKLQHISEVIPEDKRVNVYYLTTES